MGGSEDAAKLWVEQVLGDRPATQRLGLAHVIVYLNNLSDGGVD